jgi:hypothetical protein
MDDPRDDVGTLMDLDSDDEYQDLFDDGFVVTDEVAEVLDNPADTAPSVCP